MKRDLGLRRVVAGTALAFALLGGLGTTFVRGANHASMLSGASRDAGIEEDLSNEITPQEPAGAVVGEIPEIGVAGDDHNGATAVCRDGTLSYARHHRGACSYHGGVATWYR